MDPILATHCGAGSTREWQEVAEAALAVGADLLRRGRSALDAVEAAVVVLEDDPRTNAGTGSRMRFDGTIQMDASIMDSRRRAGAVAAISDVRNPIRVARKVMDTPHVLLAGPWATQFARKAGFPPFDPTTERSRERLAETRRQIAERKVPAWARKFLEYGTDTVGAVARDRRGRFASANSTGGTSFMLPGRVGDSPILGAGLYAGPAGAVGTTGIGEEIMRHVLAKHVYDRLERLGPLRACADGLRLYPRTVPIGIIAVSACGVGEAANRDMGWASNAPPRPRRR